MPDGEALGDMRLVRLPVDGFEELSLREQTLLFHFQQALLAGRDIAYAQGSKYNLPVRRTLETVLETYREGRNTAAFKELKAYANRFFFAGGLHHPISGEKLEPGFDPSQLAALVQHSDARRLPLHRGQSVASWLEQLTPILFSPAVEPRVTRATKASTAVIDSHTLAPVAQALQRALPFARGSQREALEALVEHLQTGSRSAFERYRQLRAVEQEARVDLALGLLEGGDDAQGLGGRFAGVASFVTAPDARTTTLREHASELATDLPLHEGTFEPTEAPIHVRTLQAVVGGGAWATRLPTSLELVPAGPGRGHPATLPNVVQAVLSAEGRGTVVALLTLGAREQRRAREHGDAARRLLDDLRCTLGHSIAPLPKGASEPVASLGRNARLLLAARADLIALYLAFDPRLIALGTIPSFEVARALYDDYVRQALLTSLESLVEDAPPIDTHVLASRLVVQWARSQDRPEAPAVQRVLKEGETYFVIADYRTLRRRFGQLLGEIQRILAEGDGAAAATLVARHAEPVEAALREQVRTRLGAMRVQPASVVGVLTPRLVADHEGDAIQEVRLHYAHDGLSQALEDSRRLAPTPTISE